MQQPFNQATPAPPTTEDINRIWRTDRCLQESSAKVYLQWIRRFRAYLVRHKLNECAELTLEGARRFFVWYARRRHLTGLRVSKAGAALHALSRVYRVMGITVPSWHVPRPTRPPASALLREYAAHLDRHRGNPAVTIRKKLAHVGKLFEHLAGRGKTWRTMALLDVDDFLIEGARRYSRSTVADMAGSIRSFSRFLFATSRIPIDLAEAVISPVQPRFERPRRALYWEEVRRLLLSVDTSTSRGLRDHALLLMMSTYGFGAGEVIRLQFEDIDWTAATIRVIRPKTGVSFMLPLLPPVAKALASYLRKGRPQNTPTRHLFVAMKMPFHSLDGSSSIRHILVKHGRAAGLDASRLGSHVLRHTHAARQIDLGVRPQVLSDLLGHHDSESISAYVRIAPETLRNISLPVPA
jgi:integrase/recombinase XerD